MADAHAPRSRRPSTAADNTATVRRVTTMVLRESGGPAEPDEYSPLLTVSRSRARIHGGQGSHEPPFLTRNISQTGNSSPGPRDRDGVQSVKLTAPLGPNNRQF